MKATDDYEAKLRFWAAEGRVVATPSPLRFPPFTKRSFSSYEELNAWKSDLLARAIREAQTDGRGP